MRIGALQHHFLSPLKTLYIADQAAQDQHVLKTLLLIVRKPYGGGSSNSCSLSFPAFFDSLSDQSGISSTIASITVGDQALRCNQRELSSILQGETSYDHIGSSSSIVQPVSDVSIEEYHKLSVCTDQITDTNEDRESNSDRSVKWTPSTMKLMQKMTNQPDQVPENIPITFKFQIARRDDQNRETNTGDASSSSLTIANKKSCSGVSTAVRVCSDCSTSTTPLWRSGPRGPKSLCNACGIRQRKARRCLAEAAAAAAVATGLGGGTSGTATTTAAASTKSTISIMSMGKEKKSRRNHNFIVSSRKKGKLIITDDITNTAEPSKDYNSSNKEIYDFKQVAAAKPPSVLFPLGVEEAAILLMDLSSGAI